MEISSTWRELLENILHESQERQRIAQELGVSTVTLARWTNGTSNPRSQNLRRLLEVLPQYRSQLHQLILKEFPDFANTTTEEIPEVAQSLIPSTFYSRVFDAYTTAPKIQRFWAISNLVLQQALEQLDPHQLGMAIIIVQCMSPWDDHKIYSLRERAGHGTHPWSMNLEQHAIFLGTESLAGNVVSNGYPRVLQNRNEYQGILPAHWVEWEQSAVAHPLLRSSMISGCLLISSTQPNYFTPVRQQLIQHYAELLSFIFEPHEFYELPQINLRTMPYYRVQEAHLATFRLRVANLMAQALKDGQPMNLTQAEQVIWQQIEKELLATH